MRHKEFVSYSNVCEMEWNREREAELMLWPCKLLPKGGIRWPQVPFGGLRVFRGESGLGARRDGDPMYETFVTSRAVKTQIQKFGLKKWKKTMQPSTTFCNLF